MLPLFPTDATNPKLGMWYNMGMLPKWVDFSEGSLL